MSLDLELHLRLQLDTFALSVDWQLPPQGITALYGRSGCGKTTLLRCIAGLEPAVTGSVRFGSETWQDDHHYSKAHQRPVGLVFQDARLFPHLDVLGNLDYAARRAPTGRRAISVPQVSALLGLEQLLARDTQSLSGGQRQRVAIARALLTNPRLLLLDEPLASLDAESRAGLLPQLERLHSELGLPMIYVSHALPEIMRLADSLALMEHGGIRASGPLAAMLVRDDLPFAHQPDAGVVLHGTLRSHEVAQHLSLVEIAGAIFCISPHAGAPGQAVRLRVEARDVSVTLRPPLETSINNILPCTLGAIHDDREPAQQLLQLDAAGQTVLARITRRSVQNLRLQPGLQLYAQVKTVALMD
jgi:molybdate transport system ATP-binding protein